ncbi:MAG: hypothetical protein IE912_03075, partial [Brevundimonas diminuta]
MTDSNKEAPAEAGELQGAIAFMEGAAVMLGRGEMPAPGSQYAAAWWKAHAAVLSALRAQPQAREEAQPVAWAIFWRHAMTLHPTLEDAETARSVPHDIVPLYT